MTNDIVQSQSDAEIMESVVIGGDLSKLTPTQRVMYYRQVCQSIGLNYLTRPFEYIILNGKLTLYARKDAADQLRKIHGVSISKPDIQFQDDLIIVTVEGHDKTGRGDSEVGVVKKTDMRGDVANAIMKAVTKAKRRLTLSICGLGWLDETEVETIPEVEYVDSEVIEQEYAMPAMSYDEACSITNSEGVPYGELGIDKLGFMARSINKRIKNNHLEEAELFELRRKLQAIQVIQDHDK